MNTPDEIRAWAPPARAILQTVPPPCQPAAAGCMTPIEALLEVQRALRARGLPGGAGLRERDRCFIVQLAPGDLGARPAVAELLAAMGCNVIANGHRDIVYGKLAGRLLPAPELPPVHVSSSDSCSAAELAAVAGVKRCNDCARVKPVTEFAFLNRATGRRCAYCLPCDRLRQKRAREDRRARAVVR